MVKAQHSPKANRLKARVAIARELRRVETEAEQTAWRLLRGLRLKGFKFRRQHPVGNVIVDFCCPQRRLVLELDGSVHSQPSRAAGDRRRDDYLKRLGYRVLRFPNGIVLTDPDAFMEKIMDCVSSLPNVFPGDL